MRHYLTAQISLNRVRHNLQVLRERLPDGCKLCAVVKANCYGHSVSVLLETIAKEADALAVATIPEALAIRETGCMAPLLVMLPCPVRVGGEHMEAAAQAIRHGVQLTLAEPADVAPLQRLAKTLHKRPGVHVKVDTGMGRGGALPVDALALVRALDKAGPLRWTGIYTHFATSDEADKTFAQTQFASFRSLLDQLNPPDGVVRHAANSAAIADLPHAALDMVRPGIAIYGYAPSDEIDSPLPVRPALRLIGPILQTKDLPAGSTCGYGRICRLSRDSRVGIIPAGYADGIPRRLSSCCPVGVGQAVVPVLGRISMDQIVIDLTDHPEVGVGQPVELISPDPNTPHSVANLARLAQTIPYEITSRLGPRITYEAVDDFT